MSKQATKTSHKSTTTGRLRGILPAAIDPFVLYAYADPRAPVPGPRRIRIDGRDVIIRQDYVDPRTGQFSDAVEDVYPIGEDGRAGPLKKRIFIGPGGGAGSSDTFQYDSLGRLVRVDRRDSNGNTQRVTTYAYYSDGSVIVTTTDYSTSPTTVTQQTYPPPGTPRPI